MKAIMILSLMLIFSTTSAFADEFYIGKAYPPTEAINATIANFLIIDEEFNNYAGKQRYGQEDRYKLFYCYSSGSCFALDLLKLDNDKWVILLNSKENGRPTSYLVRLPKIQL